MQEGGSSGGGGGGGGGSSGGSSGGGGKGAVSGPGAKGLASCEYKAGVSGKRLLAAMDKGHVFDQQAALLTEYFLPTFSF